MVYRLVQSFDDGTRYEIAGRTYPLPCVVEDGDGFRLLLVRPSATGEVSARVWHDAHTLGACAMLAFVNEAERRWQFVTADDFLAHRSENAARQVYAPAQWSEIAGILMPGFRDLLNAPVPAAPPRSNFVHLHAHSEFSPPDGYSRVGELVTLAAEDGQPAFGLTDHGSCAGHPDLAKHAGEKGLNPVFGMEAYFRPDRFARGAEHRYAYWHLTLLAGDDEGLRNLWAMSTEGYRDGLYDGRPQIDWDTLSRLSAGVYAATGCLRGPVVNPLLARDGKVPDEGQATANFARLLDIFGDRLYAEIHTNAMPEQVQVNQWLIAQARSLRVPLLAAVDSHYPCAGDREFHKAMLVLRNKKQSLEDDTGMFQGDDAYPLLTAAEVRGALAYLPADVVAEAMGNTVSLAAKCTAQIRPVTALPVYSKGENAVQRDLERAIDLCLGNWAKVKDKAHSQDVYRERFEREAKLLTGKQFWGYFHVVRDYVWAAKNRDKLPEDVIRALGGKRTPILVGPGRGSGSGSLVAYLMDITEVDPVEGELIFERFLTEGRTSLPDFDVDFPASERTWIKDYVRYTWGEDYVVTVGTSSRIHAKSAVREVARIYKDRYPVEWGDLERMKKLVERMEAPLAGKHVTWEDFAEHQMAKEFAAKYPELWALAERFYGRFRAFSQHPGGVVISTDQPLVGTLPLRAGPDGHLVTQFDMEALDALHYVKFDLLTIRTLDTIQWAIDAIRDRHGVTVNPYAWREEYRDLHVWEQIAAGRTAGLFQVETPDGTKMCKDFRPASLADMAAVTTLVRPGPKDSGLTKIYLRRRNGEEAVSFQDPRLATVLSDTYGTILYQEDVMATCMVLAGYDSNEADEVRKILGKKQIEKVFEAGRKFVSRAVENGMERVAAEALFAQIAEFARYSFGKAHAYSYGMISYWTGWFKYNYPVEFLTALLSTVDDDRVPVFVSEARWMGYRVLPPDINESHSGFTPGNMVIRYGFAGVKGIGEAVSDAVAAGQPYASFDDFCARAVEPKGSKVGSDKVRLLARVGAFDTLEPNRRALEERLAWQADGLDEKCIFKDPGAAGPNGLPCVFDWPAEPPRLSPKTGKVLPQLPVPKRCTKACRNYTRPETIDTSDAAPYTDAEVREVERELLGTYLSSTPFDVVPEEWRYRFVKPEDIEAGGANEYPICGFVTRVTERADRTGKFYAWVTVETEWGMVEAPCWSKQWAQYRPLLTAGPNRLLYLCVSKGDRGLSLSYVRTEI